MIDLRPFTHFALTDRQKIALCDRVLEYAKRPAFDTTALDRRLRRMEGSAVNEIAKAINGARKTLTDYIRSTFDSKSSTLDWIEKLQIRNWGPVRSGFREMSRMAFTAGQRDVRREVSGSVEMAEPITPMRAVDFMDQRIFWITGVLRDDLTRRAQGVLARAIEFGEPLDDTIGKLADLFAPYILEGVSPEVVTPWRLETIVRTNMTEAYNSGRLEEMQDPEMDIFIKGIEYSAILDERTTPICEFLHGKVFEKDDPDIDRLSAPNHFNCRSVMVPVMVGEEVGEYITEAEKAEALDMISVGFGGDKAEYAARAALPKLYADWDESKHPRYPKGDEKGGEFAPAGGGQITNDSEFKEWFAGSKIVDQQGNPAVVFHQTSKEAAEAIEREGFRLDKGRARLSDERIPDGVFFKPTDQDIKVGGTSDTVQLRAYLSIKNPLIIRTEDSGMALKQLMMNEDKQYDELVYKYQEMDRRYIKIDNELHGRLKNLDRNDRAAADKVFDEMHTNIENWKLEGDKLAAQMRERVTNYLTTNGYDGLILERDIGSFNRRTRTIVALRPEQIRLAKP